MKLEKILKEIVKAISIIVTTSYIYEKFLILFNVSDEITITRAIIILVYAIAMINLIEYSFKE